MLMKKTNCWWVTLLFLFICTKYVAHISTWYTHPILISVTIFLWVCLIAYGLHLRKLFNSEAGKKERQTYFEQLIEKGAFSYVVTYGTLATILIPFIAIISDYIKHPDINFPYANLWWGLLGYPFIYLSWAVLKKRYGK